MNPDDLKKILSRIHQGRLTPEQGLEKLKRLPFEDLEFARIDHHRHLRSGMPEVIYCEGKTPAQLLAIIQNMNQAGSDILGTRLNAEAHKKLKAKLPKNAEYNATAKTLVIRKGKKKKGCGNVLVLTAGTSDIPVAEEAATTADLLGSRVETLFDVGVAGIHRLLTAIDKLREAHAIVAVAGMDGALPSVVGGLVDCPVIAVPTSVGYGASFNGLSALLTMLNSCAAGVATVNIDNGFGAGCLAHKINRQSVQK